MATKQHLAGRKEKPVTPMPSKPAGEKRDKHRPQELPLSKQPVSVLRTVVAPSRPKSVDPRFDRSFGHFNADLFKKTYDFVDDMQHNEHRVLRETLKTAQSTEKKAAIQRLLDRHAAMEAQSRRDERRQQVKREWRKKEAEAIASGRKQSAFHLKKNELDKLVLASEYAELKERNAGRPVDVERMLEKRRRRRAARQHTRLPFRNSNTGLHDAGQ